MKLVVTGALGHIGSYVIREIPKHFPQAHIIMVDNMMTQRYCSLFSLPSTGMYEFIEADVLNVDLTRIVEGVDVVLHLAAITDAVGSFQSKELLEHNNFSTTANVARACATAEVPLIHMSSTSVYGTQQAIVDEECSLEELKPQSPYAETKLKEERYLQDLGRSAGLKFVICRFGTICGVSPGMRFHTAANKFCWQAVMGQPLTVWKTALYQKRPYLSLDDAFNAYKFIITNKLYDNRIYNILTENLTVNEIIQFIGCQIPGLSIQYVDAEIMNQLSYDVSNQRSLKSGFRFTGSIKKSIGDTISLLKNSCHPHG